MPRSTYTVKEAAELLGVSKVSAYAYIKAGTFPAPTINLGGRIVVPAAPLRELLGLPPLGEEVSA